MNTKIYVNGGIVIETPFFKYKNASAPYTAPPIDAEILEPNKEIDGKPYLLISEGNTPSFFKEYYAKTFFTTKYKFAPVFTNTLDDWLQEFSDRIAEVFEILKSNDVSEDTRQNLYRMSLASAVAALDSYISGIVLFAATRNRNIFLKAAKMVCGNRSSDIISRITQMWCDNIFDSAEWDVVESILRYPYSSFETIKKVLKEIYGENVAYNKEITDIIELRHLIVHRCGKQKDGKTVNFSKEELLHKIKSIVNFASQVNTIVANCQVAKGLVNQIV